MYLQGEYFGNETGKLGTKQKKAVLEKYTQDVIKLIEKSKEPGTFKDSEKIGSVEDWLVNKATEYGLDIKGYEHSIDVSAIKHIIKKHGNQSREQARGQVAITEKDIISIPSVVSNPDFIVFGTKTSSGLDGILYVKTMPDGTTNYVEEVRTGKNTLSAKSMWKQKSVRPTAESIRNSISLNALSDTDIDIIANPSDSVKSKLEQSAQTDVKNLPREKKITRGEFDALTKSIKLYEDANFSTLPHELAHFWLDNIWNYTQSGLASPEYRTEEK